MEQTSTMRNKVGGAPKSYYYFVWLEYPRKRLGKIHVLRDGGLHLCITLNSHLEDTRTFLGLKCSVTLSQLSVPSEK